jgi:hypothetical protein
VVVAGVPLPKLNNGFVASVAGAAEAAVAAAELPWVAAGVTLKILPAAAGFVPKRDVVGVAVPENREPAFGAVESPVPGVPNKPPVEAFEAWLLSVGGGPAGVVEKLNVFVGAGVVDPDAAPVEPGVPKLTPCIPAGLFSVLVDAPPSSLFCPNTPLLKEGVDVFAVPKIPPPDVEELVVVAVFPPNRPLEGVLPVPLPSPKAGGLAGVAFGVELEVPNIDVCWLPPAVRPPNRFFGAWDVAVAGWPNSELVGVEAAPIVMLGVLCEVLDGAPNRLDAPLPEAEPKLNGEAILTRGEGS